MIYVEIMVYHHVPILAEMDIQFHAVGSQFNSFAEGGFRIFGGVSGGPPVSEYQHEQFLPIIEAIDFSSLLAARVSGFRARATAARPKKCRKRLRTGQGLFPA